MLRLWIGIGWAILLGVMWLHSTLKSQADLLLHEDLGKSLLHSKQPATRKTKGEQRWIPSRPRYLTLNGSQHNAVVKPTSMLPRALIGDPGNPKHPGQQKMFNIMVFGRNEAIFHT